MSKQYRIIEYIGEQKWINTTLSKSLPLGSNSIGKFEIIVHHIDEEDIKYFGLCKRINRDYADVFLEGDNAQCNEE